MALVHLIRFSTLAFLFTGATLAAFHTSRVMAQSGRDLGCSPTVANPCSSGGGSHGGGINLRPLFGLDGPSKADQEQQQRLTDAFNLNHQGIEFQKSGDWAKAVALFEEAARISPDDPVIRQNLAYSRIMLADLRSKEDARQRDKAAAGHMKAAIQDFAKTLKASPSPGGLDFDGGHSPPASGALDFASALPVPTPAKPGCAALSDAKVVDACNVPSGLPKDVEDAIAGAYRNAPPGVSDRVRKAFQSLMERDWKAAKAWFQDALNRDSDNPGLKRMVDLADHALPNRKTESRNDTRPAPGRKGYSPSQAEIGEFARNIREGRYTLPLETRIYFWTLPDEEFRRVLALPPAGQLQLPTDEDVKLLFPGEAIQDHSTPPRLMQVLRATILHVEIDPEAERLVRAYAAQFK